ncbi:MAG TPA: serine hydrolase domain-containing protein [Chitinophagaceae bacterium]
MKEDTIPATLAGRMASPVSGAMPVPPSFSPVRLACMRAAMQRHLDRGWAPGLITYVYHKGRDHVEVMGTTAFGSQEPLRRDSIFRQASTTKPVTAVGAMILVEECRLRLDDPVDDWLPELANRKVLRTINSPLDDVVPARRPITVRDLFTFRSGYGEVFFSAPGCPLHQAMIQARLPLAEWIFPGTADEFLQRLGELPLACQPGEQWLYHMSAEILGVLVSRVAGRPLGQFLRERLFEPLGMKDTGFFVPQEQLYRLPPCYGRDMTTGELVVLEEAGGGRVAQPPLFESGAGGLVSTIDDMAAFGRMMLQGGAGERERILSRPSIELMTRDHLTREQKAISPFFPGTWDSRGWGLGLGVITANTDLGERPGRFGWDGAFGTSWYVDPQEGLVGVLMIQRRPDTLQLPAITTDFWNSVYQLIPD